MRKKAILIIGNGHTSSWQNCYKINYNLCQFLSNLKSSNYNLTWAQSMRVEKNITGLNTTEIPKNITVCNINKKSLISILAICVKILRSDFVYIFFPGAKGYWISLFCYFFRIKYGIYVRGLIKKNMTLLDFILRRSQINNFVQGLGQDFKSIYPNINIIKPMTEMFNFKENIISKKGYKILPYKFLFVGRLERDKGVFELLDAFNKLFVKYKNIELTLVGKGDSSEKIEKYIQTSNNKNIFLKGLVTDQHTLREIYKNAHVIILPTYHEGFPRVLYEAASFGLILVSTSVGGIPHVLSSGKDFLEIKPKSVSTIVDAISKIIVEENLRKKLIKNSYLTVQRLQKEYLDHHDLLINKFEELKLTS